MAEILSNFILVGFMRLIKSCMATSEKKMRFHLQFGISFIFGLIFYSSFAWHSVAETLLIPNVPFISNAPLTPRPPYFPN